MILFPWPALFNQLRDILNLLRQIRDELVAIRKLLAERPPTPTAIRWHVGTPEKEQ